jgi:hypothetical protein
MNTGPPAITSSVALGSTMMSCPANVAVIQNKTGKMKEMEIIRTKNICFILSLSPEKGVRLLLKYKISR